MSRVRLGVLPDNLYIEPEPWPRIGRSPRHDVEAWTVTDDRPPNPVPSTDAELDVFEAWFGDLFDERALRPKGLQCQSGANYRVVLLSFSRRYAKSSPHSLGEVPERSNGAVSKTVVPLTGDRGFESLPLRHFRTELGTPRTAGFTPAAAVSV
jgi:hypothetical protein